jgi:hypothetical protein
MAMIQGISNKTASILYPSPASVERNIVNYQWEVKKGEKTVFKSDIRGKSDRLRRGSDSGRPPGEKNCFRAGLNKGRMREKGGEGGGSEEIRPT